MLDTNSTTIAPFPFTKGQHLRHTTTGERGIVQGWTLTTYPRTGVTTWVMGLRWSFPSGDSAISSTIEGWVADEMEAAPAPMISEHFCCPECHSSVALVFQLGGDLSYECVNPRCGKTVSADCPEALALREAVTIEVTAQAQAEALPPIEMLATSAADLVLAADDAGDTRLVNSLNRAAAQLHSGARVIATAGGFLVPSGTRGGIVHRVNTRGCSCESGRAGKPCWHKSAVDVVADARARLVVLAYRQRVAA